MPGGDNVSNDANMKEDEHYNHFGSLLIHYYFLIGNMGLPVDSCKLAVKCALREMSSVFPNPRDLIERELFEMSMSEERKRTNLTKLKSSNKSSNKVHVLRYDGKHTLCNRTITDKWHPVDDFWDNEVYEKCLVCSGKAYHF